MLTREAHYVVGSFLVGLTLLLMIAGGCSLKPAPTTEQTIEKALPETTRIPEIFAEEADYGKVDAGWLKSFADPKLEALVEEALTNNMDLQVSAAQVERAAATSRLAGSALKPTVGYGASISESNIGNEQTEAIVASQSYNAGLSLSWEADVWGRVRAGTAAADESLRATEADFEYARQSIAAAVAKFWFICIETKLQLDFAGEVAVIMKETFDLLTVKHEVGQIPMQDVHLAKANYASALNAQQQAKLAHERALRGLELLLGRYPSGELKTALSLPQMPPALPAGLPSELLERRPDLIAAERNVAAAFYLEQEAKLAKLPRFSLTASTGTSNLSDSIAGLSAGLFGPLYAGGALEAQVEVATADQKAAITVYGHKVLTAFQEVENLLSGEKNLENQELYLQSMTDEYEQSLELAQIEYQVGKVDLLSVLIIQGQWVGARIALINIKDQRLLQRVDLHLALGGSFEELKQAGEEKGDY